MAVKRKAHGKVVAKTTTKKKKKTTTAQPAAVKLKPNPKLEDLLVADRSDAWTWQVYADWLLEQGEPWGEVIVQACAGKRPKKRYDEVEALLGGIDGAEIKWKNGVIDFLRLAPEECPEKNEEESRMAHALAAILRHPAGRLVRAITLGLPPRVPGNITWNFDEVIQAIGSVGSLPLLEVLDLTPDAQHMDQESWRRVGDLRPLWKAAPRLRALHLKGSRGSDRSSPPIRFGEAIDAPRLETLTYISSGLDKAAPIELGKSKFPALKHLELYFGSTDYGNNCTMESLSSLLEGKGLPKLKRLGLMNSPWEADFIETIAKSALLKRIDHLDLSKGVLFSEGADALLRLSSKFAHLAVLDLDDNFIPDEYEARFKKVLPKARFGGQRFPEQGYRFTAIGE